MGSGGACPDIQSQIAARGTALFVLRAESGSSGMQTTCGLALLGARCYLAAMGGGSVRVAAFGGAYANPHALGAVLEDARSAGAHRIINLGDLGGFGADINGVWPLLR